MSNYGVGNGGYESVEETALKIEYQRLSWRRIASLDAESDDYVLISLDSV
jgi:hypothetical protein